VSFSCKRNAELTQLALYISQSGIALCSLIGIKTAALTTTSPVVLLFPADMHADRGEQGLPFITIHNHETERKKDEQRSNFLHARNLLCLIQRFGHRVDRVLSFLSSRQNWDSPTPSPAGECPPPSLVRGTYTVVLYIIYALCGFDPSEIVLGKILNRFFSFS
jgi:hypothetical protein